MKRIAAVAALVAFVPLAGAELYKYVDKNGRTVYADQPPAGIDSKVVKDANVSSAAPPKTALDKDKALEKGRKEAREKADKADKTAARDREQEQRCQQAKQNVQAYQEGGRMYKYNDKGEREFMGEDEIASGLKKAQRDMDEACKKS